MGDINGCERWEIVQVGILGRSHWKIAERKITMKVIKASCMATFAVLR